MLPWAAYPRKGVATRAPAHGSRRRPRGRTARGTPAPSRCSERSLALLSDEGGPLVHGVAAGIGHAETVALEVGEELDAARDVAKRGVGPHDHAP
jgi:hypothetical protein